MTPARAALAEAIRRVVAELPATLVNMVATAIETTAAAGQSAAGQHGLLHAKCAVPDDRCLLISSANLTDHAFNLNIELGIMVRGGDLPARVAAHWTSLMTAGTLRRVHG